MKFIIIFGPPAVGKMVVSKELSKRTGFKLLHYHMTIELLIQIFDHGRFYYQKNYLKIFNTNLSVKETVDKIVNAFDFN